MSSATQQTERRRQLRKADAGKKNKKARAKHGTPAFPIHPEKAESASKK